MSLEDKLDSSDADWTITSNSSLHSLEAKDKINSPMSTLIQTNQLKNEINEETIPNFLINNLNRKQLINSKSFIRYDSSLTDTNINNLNMSNSNIQLTAETLRILSTINIENLDFNSKFDLLFNDISMLKASAVQGILANTNFRFLAWMIFLDCIPMDKSKWIDTIFQHRATYEKIKNEICCDPHENYTPNSNASFSSNNEQINMNLDHPLSQNNKSTWNKYFSHNQMKAVIIQDVIRINHHNEFFSQQSTQDKIVDLLFIYVQFTQSEYRQGMHEILSSIMYVIHQEYSNLSKITSSNDLIKKVVSLEYLEHDTFTIFQAVMETMNEWFGTRLKPTDQHFNRSLSCPRQNGIIQLTTDPKLFQIEEKNIESKIIHKINYITNVVLKNNDTEIFDHLKKIDVSLCPFGIRWLRLLFTRELDFPSCLVLWDAIFATDCHEFSLVNYIFVALLTYLRDDILRMDNSSCLHLLMHPHLNLDSLDILKTALYLQNPAIYDRPISMESSYEIINSTTNKNPLTPQRHGPNQNSRINQNDKDKNNNHNSIQVKRTDFNPTKISYKLDYEIPSYSKNFENKNILKRENNEMKLFNMQHSQHNVDLVIHTYVNKITELQNENQLLKMKLFEIEDLCNRSSIKLNANISILQDEIIKSNDLKDDDTTLLSLAGLKQVRDQLNPAFREEEEQINTSKDNKIKYRKNQQHQIIQTHFEPSSPSSHSSSDLTLPDQENQNELVNQKKSLKRRLSLFLKKSNQSSDKTDSKENEIEGEKSQSIRGRLRSFSLFNNSNANDFYPSSNVNLQSTKIDNVQQIDKPDETSSLDDDAFVDLKNGKLVLNTEDDKEKKFDIPTNDQNS